MEFSQEAIRSPLTETAETLFEQADQLEKKLARSSMTQEAELLWFGKTRRDEVMQLRRTARALLRQRFDWEG